MSVGCFMVEHAHSHFGSPSVRVLDFVFELADDLTERYSSLKFFEV